VTRSDRKEEKSKKINKKDILFKLVYRPFKPSKDFMTKEYTLLKRIFEKFPDEEFWLKSSFQQVKSLAIHIADDFKEIEKRYKDFHYKPQFKNVEINIGEKVGEDYNIAIKPKTIKDFLK
jgi:hypothetical protein